ncbi:MAG: FHA domain-containing protein [Planctomycetes bacterium]|nr:FHA domain-containing protein [Planctomycetota bacterium]
MSEFQLQIVEGARAGESVALGTERITIGRKPDNTLVFADEKVSSHHAEVVLEEGSYVLRDLASRNGTWMEGRKITEVVLSPGDAFTVGRERIVFQRVGVPAPGMAAGGDAGGDFALHTVDSGRLRGRGPRSTVGLLALLVVLAGGAGALYWQLNLSPQSPRRGPAQPVAVVDNLLPLGVDGFESGEGWTLKAAGAGFQPAATAHSGGAAIEAVATKAGDGTLLDHALARVSEPIRVVSGESLEASARIRTERGGAGAVRLRFSSADPEAGGDFVTGAVPRSSEAWAESLVRAAVPRGMDRVQVEILALLPAEGAVVGCDDVVLRKGGGEKPIEGATPGGLLINGTGVAVQVRAGPTLAVSGVRAVPDARLQGLSRSGLAVLSDAGLALAATAGEEGIRLAAQGEGSGRGLELLLPAGAAGSGVFARSGDGAFRQLPAAFPAETLQELLVGGGPSRLLVRTAAPVSMAGATQGGAYVLRVESDAVTLATGFEVPRQKAREARAAAQQALAAGKPGEALAVLRAALAQYPHDEAMLRDILQLRQEIVTRLSTRIEELQGALASALFFGLRGELVRVRGELDELERGYGADALPDPKVLETMRGTIDKRVAELTLRDWAEEAQRLQALARGFEAAGEAELVALVRAYLDKHAPEGAREGGR